MLLNITVYTFNQVEQIPSLIEAFTGWDTNNKYVLKNIYGQQIFYAIEGNDLAFYSNNLI